MVLVAINARLVRPWTPGLLVGQIVGPLPNFYNFSYVK
ncbi:hypothetical protein J2Y45_006076 [Dyadobacter sp. BE34]|nr:hypothetical protein [Dyadobacter sp. BE34]